LKYITIILGLLISISVAASAQTTMELPIVEVHDGDTIRTSLTLPAPLNNVSIRILHIDTPEMPAASYAETGKLGRANCIKEAELALQARQAVADLASGHSLMNISNYDWDKYGGRIDADVSINGVDIATYLIEKGMAVPYEGGTKTKDWCQ